jgi:hypothetical protein
VNISERRVAIDVNANAQNGLGVEADPLISQAIAESQESQHTVSESDEYRSTYFQLQTQAPYQSPSFSQSLSEESAV